MRIYCIYGYNAHRLMSMMLASMQHFPYYIDRT